MNRIAITGNICHDLEIKTSGETKILNFTVAVRRRFKDKEGNYPSDFIRCVAFNNTADFINKFFQKGSPILIEGSLQSNSYETENGEKRTSYNVVVENVDFFSTRNTNTKNENNSFEQAMQEKGVDYTVTDDDSSLPF